MIKITDIILLIIIALVLAKVVDFIITVIKIIFENDRIIKGFKQRLATGEITKDEYDYLIKDFLAKCKNGDLDA
ncbi:MAG: hypothetical protein FWG77_03895 [Treponema sp.]|nr:hypothetical protein [Treponema sp.]